MTDRVGHKHRSALGTGEIEEYEKYGMNEECRERERERKRNEWEWCLFGEWLSSGWDTGSEEGSRQSLSCVASILVRVAFRTLSFRQHFRTTGRAQRRITILQIFSRSFPENRVTIFLGG